MGTISMSHDGRYVAIRQRTPDDLTQDLELVATASSDRVPLDVESLVDFACVGDVVMTVESNSVSLLRYDGQRIDYREFEPFGKGRLVPAAGPKANAALWIGERPRLFNVRDHELESLDLVEEDLPGQIIGSLNGRRVVLARGRAVTIIDVGRGSVSSKLLPGRGKLVDFAELMQGRAYAFVSYERGTAIDVVHPQGGLIHHIDLPTASSIAFADRVALVYVKPRTLIGVDLQHGKIVSKRSAPFPPLDMALDGAGRTIVLAGFTRDSQRLSVLDVPSETFFVRSRASTAPVERTSTASPRSTRHGPGNGHTAEKAAEDPATPDPLVLWSHHDQDAESDAARDRAAELGLDDDSDLDDLDDDPALDGPESEGEFEDVELPQVPFAARHERVGPHQPYEAPEDHLRDLVDLAALRVARAIAAAEMRLPDSRSRVDIAEIAALVHSRTGSARTLLADSQRRADALEAAISQRVDATLQSGDTLPLIDVAEQFELSDFAVQILVQVAAPRVRGHVAWLMTQLTRDEHRPICDRYLVETILGGDDESRRTAIAQELDEYATLFRDGLLRQPESASSSWLGASLTVHPMILQRLRDDPLDRADSQLSTLLPTSSSLAPLGLPDALRRALERTDLPERLVVRGRSGSGKTAISCFLARRAADCIALIHTDGLQRGPGFVPALADEIHRVRLRGALPCLVGLWRTPHGASGEPLRHLLASIDSPLLFHAAPDDRPSAVLGIPPLEPLERVDGNSDIAVIDVAPLSRPERQAAWATALDAHDLSEWSDAPWLDEIADRFHAGVGAIADVVQRIPTRAPRDVAGHIIEAIRSYQEERMGPWAIAMPPLPDLGEDRPFPVMAPATERAVKEVLARIRHGDIVFDRWGFDPGQTGRVITALLHGPAGTGKTTVARALARDLDWPLYRVPIAALEASREPIAALRAVLDAADHRGLILLVCRMETLSPTLSAGLADLLERHHGVALFTTRDPEQVSPELARRLTIRVPVPLPDQAMRLRLWQALLPPTVPIAEALDFTDLAVHPWSGRTICDTLVRAALLAAENGEPLGREHLDRVIEHEPSDIAK